MTENELEVKHSKVNMASYGFGKFITELFNMAFGTYGFFYYETELGLASWLVGIGYVIFAVWNAINDPLVGFLTNRPFKFTKRWGRRFPFILIGGIPWVLSYILIFTPPMVDPISGAIILFLWLIFTTCLFDTLGSIHWVSYASIFPDKFGSLEERRTAAGISTPVGILGIALGSLLPSVFITYGDLQSYIVQGGVVVLICLIGLFASVPGCREDQLTIDKYLASYQKRKEGETFFQMTKTALKQKNFVFFIIFYFLYQFLTISMTASVAYVVRFTLNMEAIGTTLIMLGLLIGALISVFFWIKLTNKVNDNRKALIIAGFALTATTFPLIFIQDFIAIIIALTLWGLAFGGFWTILWPVLSDVIDESVVTTGRREEGIYTGIQAFFGRLAIAAQALSFAVVHSITGFVEGSSYQSPLAIIGISIHFALIPTVAILIAIMIFIGFYDLTRDKVEKIRNKLKEMNL